MVSHSIVLLWITIQWFSKKMKETLGRYKIIKEIGRGAMGVVYQGYDPKIDRIVALKTIRKDRLAESRDVEDLVTRFQKEVRATGKLVHPNIIIIYDTGEDEETTYIAMEYIEGDTLENLIQRGIRLPMEKIIDIIDKICDGLEYTHRQGIVHRDLKPSNIMLVKGERVKITDFGISKAVGAASSPLTQEGILLGTPSYMSPEQITGREIDGRSDLFSVGIILYQLLTGERPFVGDTIPALLYNIVNKDPVPPSQIGSTIPALYDEVLAKALAKNPENRYQTARDFVEDLGRASRGEALMEAPNIEKTMTVAEGVTGEIYPKRKRYGLLGGFAVLLLALVVGGYYWMYYRTPVPPEEEGVSEVKVEERVATPVKKEPVKPMPPPAPVGTMVVSSIPSGAKVFLDGEEHKELTPTAIKEVPVGKQYEIRVKKEGFKPWLDTVEAKPDKTLAIEAPLERLVGTIVVKSDPPGALVFLDDEPQKRPTPTEIEKLPVGKEYEIRVEKEGFKPWTRTVEPEADKSLPIKAKLERLVATIVVKSIPPGATVFLDDEPQKRPTPIEIEKVPVGKQYEIRVEKEGFKPWTRIVEPEPDKSLRMKATLEKFVPKPPLLGEIRISSDPSGAMVYLNDKDLDRKTPTRLSGLSLGKRYKLRLDKEGYRAWEGEVSLKDSKLLDLPKVTLEEAFGKINLQVFPWAHVYYKGKELGTTPMAAPIELQEGTHKLVLKNPPLNIEKQITVKIVADKTQKMSIDIMEGIKGSLKINVNPWADVYVDGKKMGSTPLKPLELTVGEHEVQLKNELLKMERSFKVTIKANEVKEVVSKDVNWIKKK
jgi:tRNA A-37 threonylcarbamoyl transferase component Bud32